MVLRNAFHWCCAVTSQRPVFKSCYYKYLSHVSPDVTFTSYEVCVARGWKNTLAVGGATHSLGAYIPGQLSLWRIGVRGPNFQRTAPGVA